MSDFAETVTENPLRHQLAWFGALPFMAGVVLTLAGITTIPGLPSLTVDMVIAVYGLVIATFMAGAHWGQYLAFDDHGATRLAVISNLQAVALWLAFLLAPHTGFIAVLIASFALSLYEDLRLLRNWQISRPYWLTRLRVSLVVMGCLVVTVL